MNSDKPNVLKKWMNTIEALVKQFFVRTSKNVPAITSPSTYNRALEEEALNVHSDKKRFQPPLRKKIPCAHFHPGAGYKELVNFGEYIGDYSDIVTGDMTPTTRGIIHYDKNGEVHIVPARPQSLPTNNTHKGDLLLQSVQRAITLWDVYSSVRAVSIEWNEQSIDIYFIYDGDISDENIELSESVATEVLADFPDEEAIRTHHIRCDYPQSIPQIGLEFVYRRKGCLPSVLSRSEPTILLKRYAGAGIPQGKPGEAGFKEVIVCDDIIGEWFDKSIKQYVPTKRIVIHYDKNFGAFIVPASPRASKKAADSTNLEDPSKRDILFLSIQAAIDLQDVCSSLRALCAGWDKQSIDIYFIYDGAISDNDRESSERITTEVLADFPDESVEAHHIRCDLPAPVPQLGKECVYKRKE